MNITIYDTDIQKLNDELLKQRSKMSKKIVGCCRKLAQKARQIQDPALEGYAYYYMAESYYLFSADQKRFNNALLKSLKLSQIGEDNEMLSRCYNLLGAAALNSGTKELALNFHFTALKYCDNLENSNLDGIVKYNIGRTFFTIGNISQALKYLKLAEKSIKRNKKDSFYYRNLLLFYCFKADCGIALNNPEMVTECLQGIDELENSKNIPEDFFTDYPVVDIRMRSNYFLGNITESMKYGDSIRELILNGEATLDSMEDVIETTRFLVKAGKVSEAVKVIDVAEKNISKIQIPNVRMNYAKLKYDVFTLTGDKKKVSSALQEYYDYSMLQQQQSIDSYSFFSDIRTTILNVEKENNRLKAQAETDSLTGLGNRFALNRHLDASFERAYKDSSTLALEILDFDFFKNLNDKYGHQAGDVALKRVAGEISKITSKNPCINGFRYGGDEFVIIYEKMSDSEIKVFAEKLRTAVNALKIENSLGKKKEYLTISQGIKNGIPDQKTKPWDYLTLADNALYDVKKNNKGGIALT